MGQKARKSSSTNNYYPIIQRSNFVLELVQNADENVYPCDVEATLTFIFQEKSVIVLNNDQGFSAESMKALCDDVCNITKKEPSGDTYIDNKGIGFKSVFRVSDAPEIHSNEFNIKFNISDGSETANLCDVSQFCKMAASDCDPEDEKRWKTCMVLPKKNEALAVEDIVSIFCKLHPHVMLFLQRLKCIKYINFVHGSYVFMRKEVVGDGMVKISSHDEKATWFIKKFRLQADHVRQDVKTTEISMALMLKDSNNGNYTPHLCPQLVFAFLRPVGYYGFKFIIQADFIVSSSMEKVDADSPWNQWLLSEFPNVFVSAELSFCSLPCFRENPARGVSVFLSFVPLGEEVCGFFSSLPHKIISKLCVSNCLLLEGGCNEWVRPCKVVRNWTEQIRSLLPDSLIKEHLDVGYLNKDVVLSDSLAQALGIEDCGPKFLVQVMISLCRADSLKSLGLSWLSSWLNVLFLMLVDETEYDVISSLSQLLVIPLFDGNYTSIGEGGIWLFTDEPGFEMFGKLYPSPELRIVDPDLLSVHPENITEMLYKFGVQRLSAHEVFKLHILPSICDEKVLTESTELMIEYLSFIMYHLESRCSKCRAEKEHIFSQLRNNAYISTNYGCKRPVDVPIHFSEEFGNPFEMNKLVTGTNMTWYEIDIRYLKHPVYKSTPNGTLKWRKFLQKLGVTDFVQVVEVEKRVEDIKYTSPELMHLLSHVTTHGDGEKSKYLLKVVSKLWDGHLSNKPYKSYVIRMLHDYPWMASAMDDRLHFPKDLFHHCKVVHMVLGTRAPCTVPKVSSVKFSNDIGLKKTITLDDALSILDVWRGSKIPHRASVSQMSKFYTYLCNRMSISKQKIVKKLHSQAFIFVPHSFSSTHEVVVSGSFLSPSEVYWHDSFGSIEQTKSIHPLCNKMLCNVYPGLHNFFVNEFGVAENPTLLSYLQSLLQLSTESLPSQAAKTFFHVLIKWSDGLDSWVLSSEDIDYMKKSMEKRKMRIFPTVQNKWVSLHQSFGLVCWCDDEQLRKEFMNLKNVHFLSFGQLSTEEKQMLQDKVFVLLRRLGIPSLSEVVTREAIYSVLIDNSFIAYFINGALPYAQRYIYSFHRKEYSEFKNLKIVVVKKLLYKNVIKKFGIESSKQFECSCLLQDNILYATPDSDSDPHSLFMELSRFLVAGVPEFPLADFLHRILTTESGYIEEQLELFSINKQKLLKLPSEESEWSMFSISSPEDGKLSPTTSSGLSPEVPSPAKSTSKKLQRRSRGKPVFLKYASKKKEVNKWVSLHQSFGPVCWCDDEQLRKEFMNLKNVHFLSFWQLSTEEKQMLQDKVFLLLRRLGIPSLSEVVTREAIYSGVMDNSFIAYFINGALPYAQRYIYSFHRKEYSEFKNLKIVVVKKLLYKNVIKKFGIESSKQFECSCLLQDNILYATPDSDSDPHSLFMELSRFLVAGVPEFPLADFLHRILTTESGYIEEQLELFSINKQKLLKLPSEESEWSMFSISSPEDGKLSPTTSSGLSPEVPSPAKFTSKKLQRRSRGKPVFLKYASKKKEVNKWVSLHQSFGPVCWCDDEQLRKEFMNLKNVHFLSFGQLSTEEKQMLQDKVFVLLRRLGIPSLSEVVTREAIYSGMMDNSFIAYFINGALPYAQRYIYSFHRKEYSEFKNLKIVVVKKLLYKNVIKKFGIESSKQFECSCLLQDNILYATPDSDSDPHSLFMELSRFLVAGVPEFPLADFLHRILTTESGYIEEQLELFSINKQKLLKLPSEESEWSMFSISSPEDGKLSPTTSSGLSPEVPSPAKSTSKKLQRRSRGKPVFLKYASKKKEVNSDQRRHDEASVIRKEDEDMKDQSGSGTYKDTVSSYKNDGFTSNERELVALNSEKHGERWVKKVKEGKDNSNEEESAKKIIECIRREEFGLGSDISATEKYSILKKQHSRLGEALHGLSEELYSQDSHFLLELVRNADENMYSCDVEPTLTFILQETGVIVLNNDQGFSVETIKALCKVGSSSKTEPSTGYISKKGIGFKSVFQVTDAPEIHSNRFHIKFDIRDGLIGFVLPTVVPPCDIDLFSKLGSGDNDPTDETCWKTCIVLPFRSKEDEAFPVEKLISKFSSFHPSLLLFLHRLKCIKFRNIPNNSLIVMRKQVDKDGIVNVFLGKEKFTWFVKSCRIQADYICHDVQTTEISVALILEDLGNGNYISKLDQQPVFALFPSRSYGLKFIIQADFIVCSSREEVDENSPWNQWLLLEFSNLFVNAELSFCSLPCFIKNPAKGVSVFMSFVPLEGEVHGFFSQLPNMIISKLCSSSCLLLQGEDNEWDEWNEWVPPCKVLRNWTEQTRSLLPDSLIREHLDVGYLHKDTLLTDSLARTLGIEECGPKVLIQVMASLCQADSLKSMGLGWLSSWLNVLFLMLVNATEYDFISSFSRLPIILLLDGSYASINEGAIWLNTDREHGLEAFGKLYSKLRIVNPALFSDHVENVTQMLYKVGVQRLSTHEVLKKHVLPAICDKKVMAESTELMIEYLSFIMFHLESSCCSECLVEKEHVLSQLRNNAFISTNHGFKRLVDVPIHFSKKFGNPIDMSKLVGGTDMKWFEIDISYLKHPVYKASPGRKLKWRKFLQELGVTDFVQIVKVEKSVEDICHTARNSMLLDDDWDSQELIHLLSHVSTNGNKEKGVCLLKVLDTLWDDSFSDKPFKSYVLRILHSFRWLASSMDDQLHFPKEMFHNCEKVREVLGHRAPYTVPKVNNVKFLNDIGLKKTITLDVALSILDVWRGSKKPFRARISQMTKFYTYLWSEMSVSKHKLVATLHSQAFIYVPHSFDSTNEVVSGLLLTPSEVYWHDSTGSMDQKTLTEAQLYEYMTHRVFSKMLSSVYPDLHSFFVNEFGVAESPPLLSYLRSLLHLSTKNLPSLAAKTVFQVFKTWSDGLDSEVLSSDDIDYLKESMKEKEMRILPTVQDKWVSLHESFGHIYWCEDEQLKKDFMDLSNVDFLCLGELTIEEKQMLQDKVSVLFWRLGIPCLSEVVTREVIHYGPTDSSYMISLVRWALPYAQRYIYRMHPNEYSQLKLSGFKNVNSLKIVVVEKLCQKYVIKSFGIESKERECCCLLQDNILYATRNADSHSLFMELSHILLVGLPLANFLHMITTMTKSGFTEEKMESFVTNNQKLPNLPCEELQWSLVSTSSPEVGSTTTKKFGKNLSWPPVHWKTTPGFDKTELDATEGLFESNGEWIIDENPDSSMPLVILEDGEALNDQSDSVINKGKNTVSVPPQHVITGRVGEREAFRYFSSTLSDKKVTWVNKIKESGLPYDILVKGKDKSKEYIEVKSTSVTKKDWFYLSMNEWKFAAEQGESFSIARVVLSDGKSPVITIYRNPAKLCQKRQLQLAFHPSK